MIQPFNTLRRPSRRTLLRCVLPVAALIVFGGLLWHKIAQMDLDEIWRALRQVSIGAWTLAGVATWISFHAIGHYDAIWHQMLKTDVPQPAARRAGVRAIAIAQTVGFGSLTASLVRWRCLPSLGLWDVTRLSVAVTLTFTLCWVPFALLAMWWIGPDSEAIPKYLFLLSFVAALAIPFVFALTSRFFPRLSLSRLASLLCWTGVDLLFAALALFLLLPAGTGIPFDLLLAAYIIALGLGLLSNSPGGAGAFDLTLLALLPTTAPEPLVAGIIVFRVVYYLIPACLALIAIARPSRPTHVAAPEVPLWGLATQTGETRTIKGRRWFFGDVPFALVSIGARPRAAPSVRDVKSLSAEGLHRLRLPALYNCDPRAALAATKAGWHVKRVAMEAVIRPATWTTSGSKRQTLRRKLRHAAQAGIKVELARGPLPMPELQKIATAWATRRGGEFGFSMGRFCPDLIATQRIFLIRRDSQIIGFISFFHNAGMWSLDLIRHFDTISDGAIHAAINAAIETAKAERIDQLSLATVPDPRYTPAFWHRRRAGLIQFKRSFAPVWVPRYCAAPNVFILWITGLIIAIAVHRPLPNLYWKARRWLGQVMDPRPDHRFRIAVRRQT